MNYDILLIITVLGIFIAGLITPLLLHRTEKWKTPKIKDGVPTKWGWVVRHPENLRLGKNTDIGAFTYIQAENLIIIENNVQVGSHCSIYSKNSIDKTRGIIHIEEGACIGAGCVILPKDGFELVIGKNSKIGALSLIKDSIPPNSIYAGVPAKPIKEGDLYVK